VKKGDTILCVKALPKGTFVPTSSTQDAGTSSPAEEAVTAGFGSLFLQSSPTQDVLPPDNGVLQSIAVKETDIVAKDKVLFTVTVGVVVPDAPEGTIYPLDLKVHTVSKPGDTYDSSVTTRAPVTLLSPNMEARGPIPVTAPTAGWVTKVKPKVGDLVSDGSPVVFLNIAEDRCEVSPDPNTPLPRKLDPFPECSEDDRQQSCVARCIWLSANCADIGKLAECSRAWREYELGTQPCPLDAGGKKQSTCDPSTVERVPPQPYEAASPPEFPYPFNTPQLPDPNRVLTLWEFFHKRNYHGKNYPMVLMMLGGPPKELGLTENPAPCPGLSADTTRCLADCLL
jgi:biotin carboxyl carrier protein